MHKCVAVDIKQGVLDRRLRSDIDDIVIWKGGSYLQGTLRLRELLEELSALRRASEALRLSRTFLKPIRVD